MKKTLLLVMFIRFDTNLPRTAFGSSAQLMVRGYERMCAAEGPKGELKGELRSNACFKQHTGYVLVMSHQDVEVSINGGSPSHRPFLDGISHNKNHLF